MGPVLDDLSVTVDTVDPETPFEWTIMNIENKPYDIFYYVVKPTVVVSDLEVHSPPVSPKCSHYFVGDDDDDHNADTSCCRFCDGDAENLNANGVTALIDTARKLRSFPEWDSDCEVFHASLTSCSADVDVSESDHISMCGSGDETDCPPMATRAPWLAHDPPRQRMKFGDG